MEESGATELIVQCVCTHMSFYTVIEDIPITGEEVIQSTVYYNEVPTFRDWPTISVLFYLVIFLLSATLYTCTLDRNDQV